MRKPLIAAAIIVATGAVLLGSSVAQTTGKSQTAPAKTQSTAPAKKPAAPAASPTPKSENASPFTNEKDKVSYALGMNIAASLGANLKRQNVEINHDVLIQAIKDGLSGGKTLMTEAEAQNTLRQFMSELQQKQEQKMKEAGENNKKEGDAFLAANKSKPGVVALPDGLQYKIVKEGTGPKPAPTDTVSVNYRGTLINGTEFDSSYKRGEPATFPVGGVIKGWTEALQLMPVGSKWELYIPSDLAYGARGAGADIGPNATLLFEVELLSIKGKEEPQGGQPNASPSPAPAPTPKQ
ncbi:MAG TPA: FKBP-type peptidyl-prolyl cis-trans isomerase [Candidatus Angelobacter sp.]|nr:FKBP-type peptidyl-prolyl cis-trans isomerase [Candidatus Angelobacter sp.]